MSERDQVVEILRKAISPPFKATMGDGAGNVVVDGRPGYVWCRKLGRSEMLMQAFNRGAQSIEGIIVLVKESRVEHLGYEVVGYAGGGAPDDIYPSVSPHAWTHEWRPGIGRDRVTVYPRAWGYLRAEPIETGSLVVWVTPGWLYYGDEYHWYPGGYSPAFGAPAGLTWYQTLYMDPSDRTLHIEDGIEGGYGYAEVPVPPGCMIPIAAVESTGTFSAVTENMIEDIRLFMDPIEECGTIGSAGSVLISLANQTGGQRTIGDVVVTHPSIDNSFTGTTVEGYAGKVLVVAETIESLATGTLWERGGPFDVEVEGVITWNDGLRTSGTPYLAEATSSPTGTGVFAIALSPNAGASSDFQLSVSSSNHDDYGLGYPITYIFDIPATLTSGRVYYKFVESDSWTELLTRTSSDFFNGINAVRFDYANDKAYVSIAFSSDSEDIYLRFTNESGLSIDCSYSSISSYYDNRAATVVLTADDWTGQAGRDADFQAACDACQARDIWITVGIITFFGGVAPTWASIQTELDGGYVEAASHSRTHPHIPYGDYVAEIETSRAEIVVNLDLPSLYKKGASEYVYAWLEPYGESDAAQRSQCGTSKYLADRDTTVDHVFAAWDAANDLYNRIGYSIWMGTDGTTNLATLNASFNARYGNGEIYHLWFHPNNVDWTPGQYATQHLDHISGRTDIWYVGFGALYLYHYVQERNIVTVASRSAGVISALFLDELGAPGGGDGTEIHDHSGPGEGGQLDWDDVWSDAVHDHSDDAEGGLLDWLTHIHVYKENKSAECDGAKIVFITAQQFEPYSLRVLLNGQEQVDGAANDYVEGAMYDSFTMAVAPVGGDTLIMHYLAQGA